ncbi:hypothetical protein CgunFtcFv8_027498 [Champsocephalus gunnari]|uniref:Uncharacterized protein n=1 Tax=Champsocephalus gunnari TaxID=52237 RepID=A0AAN8DZ21_CHAGU|nr:hypothetical protein CgunFtcFv8_027498 [Champsocephalus gunnari]
MQSEDIDPRVGHVDCGRPARRCPGDTARFSGSPPPVPLPLVRLGRVGLRRLQSSGRCALTDPSDLLSHPGSEASKPPLHTSGSHSPQSWSGLARIVFLSPPSSPLFSTELASLC